MKDPKTAIQTSYYSLLDGNVSIDSTNVGVYDKMNVPPADERTDQWIVLSDWTEIDDSDKSSFGSELTFTVHFYDRQEGSRGSRADLYDMVDQAKQQVRTRPNSVDLSPDFKLIWLTVDEENSLPKELTETHLTFGRQIRYRMAVQEL